MLLCIAQTLLSCCVMSEGKLVVCLLDHEVLQVREAHVTLSVAQEIAQHAQPVRTLVNGGGLLPSFPCTLGSMPFVW